LFIKHINSKHIDKKKWDDLVANSAIENVFMYSWYLDATADNWSGVVSNNYTTIFPVTYTKKLGVKQFHQAFFTRQFEVIGHDFDLNNAIEFIHDEFKFINFRSKQVLKFNHAKIDRQHQIIDFNIGFKYSTNAKRLIKKSNKFYTYKSISNLTPFVTLIKEILVDKIKEFTPKNIVKLQKLMTSAMRNGKGECIGVFEGEKFVGAGFFFKDKNTITYLKGVSTEESKKNGAMYGLIDYVINQNQSDYSIFDFGGSIVEGVATFYKKFGATNKNYNEYTINHLPLWFSIIKKLKNNV
jgi:hypothetical protein